MYSVSNESVEGAVYFGEDQRFFDLKPGEKTDWREEEFNILGIRGLTMGKFHVGVDFFEKIAASVDRMEKHASPGAYFSPEELVGFHTWSGLTDHEKNMAILVLKQVVRVPDAPWVEVCRSDGIWFKLDPKLTEYYRAAAMPPYPTSN